MAWYIFLKQCDSVPEGGSSLLGSNFLQAQIAVPFLLCDLYLTSMLKKPSGGHCSSPSPILVTETLEPGH